MPSEGAAAQAVEQQKLDQGIDQGAEGTDDSDDSKVDYGTDNP